MSNLRQNFKSDKSMAKAWCLNWGLASLYVHLPHSELGSAPPVRHIFGKQAQHMEESLNAELWQPMKDIPGVERGLCPHLSAGSISE